MGISKLEADFRFVCNRLWGSGKRRAQGFRTYFYKFADAEPATRIALLRMEIVVFMSRNTSGDYAILQQQPEQVIARLWADLSGRNWGRPIRIRSALRTGRHSE